MTGVALSVTLPPSHSVTGPLGVGGGGALASPVAPLDGASAVRQATVLTMQEVSAMAGGADVVKQVRWGRLLPMATGATLVATGLVLALDWFYQEAQRATGTTLDDWANWGGDRAHLPGA